MSSGKLVLFSGPSGVGKDTLLEVLTKKRPALQRSISLTTRQRRNGEKDGVDYFFVTPEHFQELLSAGDILEFAQYGKNLYGTPKKPVDEWLREGKLRCRARKRSSTSIRRRFPCLFCRRLWRCSSAGFATAAQRMRRTLRAVCASPVMRSVKAKTMIIAL